jgi:hypothetical protein
MATLIKSKQGSSSHEHFTGTGWTKKSFRDGEITLSEQNNMSYAPRSFAYGTGYYEQNPVVYNSKLKEKTCGKNYEPKIGTSMHHQIEYAQGFRKEIDVNLYRKRFTKVGLAEMRIDENVTEGAVHV